MNHDSLQFTVDERYSGLEFAIDENERHLGGNIKFGDPFTYCPSVWDYMISRFCAESVLDLGSGMGYASAYFHRRGLKVIAVDGLEKNIGRSVFPTIKHDLTHSPICCKVDLVYCQEVVEHIEETYLEHVLKSLCSGKIIIMTHALPGQVGYHHVNLKPAEYWIEHIRKMGYSLLKEDTLRVRMLADRDGACYMKASGLVFANYSRY